MASKIQTADIINHIKSNNGDHRHHIYTVINMIYESKLTLVFDWVHETSPDELHCSDFSDILDPIYLRKLLTAHVRLDRFREGHMKEIFQSGILLNLLQRLNEVHET